MRPKTPQHLGSAKTRAQRRPANVSTCWFCEFQLGLAAFCKNRHSSYDGKLWKGNIYQTSKGIGASKKKKASSLWVAGVISTSENKWQLSSYGTLQCELVPVWPHRHHVHGNHAAKSSGSANDGGFRQTFSVHFKPTSDGDSWQNKNLQRCFRENQEHKIHKVLIC